MTTLAAGTSAAILDAAERMTQSVGYNGLSFRDVAAAVGIKSASVHYHFPTKGQLGAAIARRYTDRFVDYMGAVDGRGLDPRAALAAYVAVFRVTLEQDGRMCLCGMLAAETDAVPQPVREEVRRFVELNVAWISGTLRRLGGNEVREHARAMFAALEGAMLVARAMGEPAVFDAMVGQFGRLGLVPR